MRKHFSVTPAILLFTLALHAQMPELTVNGKTNNGVQLQVLKIEVKVCGTVARTTWQMTFKNTTSRILEGTLNFPLKDGLSVSSYALDINGKMRYAVPVDRTKGTEVFEAIQRRRVDPGLLEKVDGNTFRTRIYPINPNNTRTVIIGYEEELPFTANAALHYYLPLNLKDTVAEFKLDVTVMQSATRPVFDSSLIENMQFSKIKDQYQASLQRNNFVPGNSLSISIPKSLNAPEVMLRPSGNNYYYLINTILHNNVREKVLPVSVGLLWDASLSGSTRNTNKETALLDAYFKKLKNASVNLVVFSNTIKRANHFVVQNGNWEGLKKYIETIAYDGATNFGNLNLKKIKVDEFILFSDGHQTLGNGQIQLSNSPVYCVNSSTTADYSNLKFIAGKTKGVVIDLQNLSITEALHKLINEPFRFLGLKQNKFSKENYPSVQVVAGSNFSIAGIVAESTGEIILQFGYGNKVTYEKPISINAQTQLCENFDISRIFAQKKIAELDIQYDLNKTEIENTGRQFGIVTRNTSLIVLETAEDYVKYQIAPPAELRAAYDSMMKEKLADMITKQKEDLELSLDMMADLKEWYNQKLPKKEIKKEMVAVTPIQTSTATAGNAAVATTAATVINNPDPIILITHFSDTSSGKKIIAGKITDIDGNPVSFASIKIKGTNTGISADANGAYTIRAGASDKFVISGASFKDVEVPVGTQNVLNTVLEKVGTELKEVVVTSAFGIKRYDHNIQNLQSAQLNFTRNANINNALAGKVSGLQVRNQSSVKLGAETTVRLRGENGMGLTGGTLYVVDGKIIPDGSFINPADVADYAVLDESAAESLFGSDASNGAIVISTKNFKPDTAYKKIADRITAEKKHDQKVKPSFDIITFDYMAAIRQTEKEKRYLKYLELRQFYIIKPTFFFEVGTWFLNTGDKANGLTILSNLAELENSNYELYKMLAYKLKEAGEYEEAFSAFKKVLELRPSDPQSYRDCGLAYADLGKYQQAVDMLYAGLTKTYSEEMYDMYEGIEEVFLTEINHITALHKTKLNLKNFNKKLLYPMQVDLRVVMNWNFSNTDIDLWITDPNDEKCFYSNTQTAQGARMTDDFTEGFGPEQFMLKKAVNGKYKIEIDFYSESQVKLSGPVTIMMEIYKYYGTAQEEKKIITLQFQNDIGKAIFIDEVVL